MHIDAVDSILGGSRYNNEESEIIVDWVFRHQSIIVEKRYGKPLREIIAILMPFKGQQQLISHKLTRKLGHQHGIIVGTVHVLQGAEPDVIIFSPVYEKNIKGTPYFDRDRTLLNVAVSRARDHFLVFGNTKLFSQSTYRSSQLLGKYLFAHESNELKKVIHPFRSLAVRKYSFLLKNEKAQDIRLDFYLDSR